jgi:hypothetical protein
MHTGSYRTLGLAAVLTAGLAAGLAVARFGVDANGDALMARFFDRHLGH